MSMNMDIDFAVAENWGDDMPERWRWMRDNDPCHWSEKSQLWVVTRYADVEYVSKHQDLFCSDFGVRPNPVKIGLIDEGEPRHGQLRKMINRGFTPRMVKKLEIVFREIATETIDKIADRSECDFVENVAVPMPLLLIAEMIGIRREDREQFHQWSDAMMAAEGNLEDPELIQRAGVAYMEYATYVTQIIEDRRKNPRDDLMSILVHAKDEGLLRRFEDTDRFEAATDEQLDLATDELIKLMVVLLVAGNETTRNGISGGMHLLIENPGERQKLIDAPSLIPAAVEEMVRLASPVRSFMRTVVKDTELHGKTLREGERILMVYPAANTDPRQYDDPESFRIDRGAPHLGFGIGTHFCLGANLARMEMRVVFEELLRRLPDMEYAEGGPVFVPHALVRTCARMLVRYTPERLAA